MAGFLAPAEDVAAARAGARNQFGDLVVGTTIPSPARAKSLSDAFLIGLQESSAGLALRGKLPEQQLGEDAPWYHRLARNVGGVVGDLPIGVAGAVAAIPTGPMGMAAGSFAAPMALRDALVEAYSHNYAMSWQGAWEITKAGLVGAGKGATIGFATMGAGRAVAPLLTPAGKVVTAAGTVGAELAALTATSAALEGQMPTWQDFMDNAILLGGMKTAVGVAGTLRNIYADVGKTPEQVLADAQRNPKVKAAVVAGAMPDEYKPVALEQRIKAAVDADPRPEAIRQILSTKEPPKLGEAPIADPVKYEYITDRDTAKGVLRLVSQQYENEIRQQTRGVVSNKQTAIEAAEMISGGKLAPHIVGEAGNAAEIYARAHLLKGATNHAVAELTKLAATPEAELSPAAKLQALAALERVAMLKSEMDGVGAEAGRALQIFRAVKRDPAFLGEAETLIKLAERKGALQDIAALARSLKDPAQLAEFAKKYTEATTTEKVIEAWKSAILSGPQTHLANILGNAVKWAVEIPESVISASLLALNKKVTGDSLSFAQWRARAFAPLYGLQLGAKDTVHAMAEALRGQESVVKADQYRQAIGGTTGKVVQVPFRLLQAEDAMFRTLAERAQAHILAVDRVVKEGLHPDTVEGRKAVVAYTQDPTAGLAADAAKAVLASIEQAGAESVFAQRLGPRMEIAQRAIAGSPFQFVVPFVRTPVNLLSWAVQHTPGLNILSARWRSEFAAGGESQARAAARVVLGTGLAMTAYALAEDGLITGAGMFDREERGTKVAAGWQPYSLKIGDRYYSYQRIEPVAKVVGIAADLIDLMRETKDEEDRSKIFGMLVLMFGNATISTTYLSGLSNAMQSLTDPARYGENFLEQYATSVVPKIVGQVTAMVDPHKREINGVLDAIQSQIPYFREKLLPKRDVWGEPQKNERWFAVMPVATSQISEDKVRKEAMRLEIAIADAPRYVMERGPFKQKEERVKLAQEQRDIFREVSGKNAMTILAPIVNAPDWERIPDFAKVAVFKQVIDGTRKQGQYAALPADAAERQALREKIIQKIVQQNQAVGRD